MTISRDELDRMSPEALQKMRDDARAEREEQRLEGERSYARAEAEIALQREKRITRRGRVLLWVPVLFAAALLVSDTARHAVARWLMRDVPFGANSIRISPGATDVLRWSGTQAATQAGELGMHVTSGRPSAFIHGAARDLIYGSETYLGGIARVDSTYGNDANGSLGGAPFASITAAVAACQSGSLVWIGPGTYNLSSTLAIPGGVAIRGASTGAVTIQRLNVTSSTTLIVMGENTRLEDVALKITTQDLGVHITGLEFPGTTSATAKWRTSTLTVDASARPSTYWGQVVGVLGNGTGAPGDETIRSCTVTARNSGSDTCYALHSTTANTISARDANFVAARTAGTGTAIGVRTNHASATLSVRYGSIQGTSADVDQNAGTIELSATALQTPSANARSFRSDLTTSVLRFGDPGAQSNGTNFLYFGTANVSGNEITYRAARPLLVKAIHVSVRLAPGSGESQAVTLRRNGADTALTATVSGASTSASLTTTSVAFAVGDTLSVKVVTTPLAASQDLTVELEIY